MREFTEIKGKFQSCSNEGHFENQKDQTVIGIVVNWKTGKGEVKLGEIKFCILAGAKR